MACKKVGNADDVRPILHGSRLVEPFRRYKDLSFGPPRWHENGAHRMVVIFEAQSHPGHRSASGL
ncbi:MAG: hypothetical protein ABW318_06165, partial [Vicinamibacterales bacterium]